MGSQSRGGADLCHCAPASGAPRSPVTLPPQALAQAHHLLRRGWGLDGFEVCSTRLQRLHVQESQNKCADKHPETVVEEG